MTLGSGIADDLGGDAVLFLGVGDRDLDFGLYGPARLRNAGPSAKLSLDDVESAWFLVGELGRGRDELDFLVAAIATATGPCS